MNYKKTYPDIENRILNDEYFYFKNKYKNVAFNYQFCGKENLPSDGYKNIVIFEPILEIPQQWDAEYLKQYDTCICFNSKMSKYLTDMGIKNINNKNYLSSFNSYFFLKKDEFLNFNNKINGILILNKTEERKKHYSDIYNLRGKYLDDLNIFPVEKHVYSKVPWKSEFYKGQIDAPYHGHYLNLKLISQYKFCLCFESTYDYFYSYDFFTERMINCIKSKTIPIYIGCYNINEFVPKEAFIDITNFKDINHLSKYIKDISKDEYEYNKVINFGYEWYKDVFEKKSSSLDLENILNNL